MRNDRSTSLAVLALFSGMVLASVVEMVLMPDDWRIQSSSFKGFTIMAIGIAASFGALLNPTHLKRRVGYVLGAFAIGMAIDAGVIRSPDSLPLFFAFLMIAFAWNVIDAAFWIGQLLRPDRRSDYSTRRAH